MYIEETHYKYQCSIFVFYESTRNHKIYCVSQLKVRVKLHLDWCTMYIDHIMMNNDQQQRYKLVSYGHYTETLPYHNFHSPHQYFSFLIAVGDFLQRVHWHSVTLCNIITLCCIAMTTSVIQRGLIWVGVIDQNCDKTGEAKWWKIQLNIHTCVPRNLIKEK